MSACDERELALGPDPTDPGGSTIAARASGRPARSGLLLGHGAGSDLDEPVLAGLARELAQRGHLVLRLRWPYRARALARGRPQPPDRSSILVATLSGCLAAARLLAPGVPWVVGGRSLGARVAAHLAAGSVSQRGEFEAPAGLLALAYPLNPPRAKRPRPTPFAGLDLPALFVQGDRDPFGDSAALERALEAAPRRPELLALARADHGLAEPRRGGRPHAEVLAEVAGRVDGWLAGLEREGKGRE